MKLLDEDAPLLVRALEDAIDYRIGDPGFCGDCTESQVCVDHVADEELAQQYGNLLNKVRS